VTRSPLNLFDHVLVNVDVGRRVQVHVTTFRRFATLAGCHSTKLAPAASDQMPVGAMNHESSGSGATGFGRTVRVHEETLAPRGTSTSYGRPSFTGADRHNVNSVTLSVALRAALQRLRHMPLGVALCPLFPPNIRLPIPVHRQLLIWYAPSWSLLASHSCCSSRPIASHGCHNG